MRKNSFSGIVFLRTISFNSLYEFTTLAKGKSNEEFIQNGEAHFIAEAIWGTPYRLRDEIMEYLPEEMQMVLWNFHDARPWSDKLLIDTTFDEIDLSDASWDLLDIDEMESLKNIVIKEKNEKRKMMLERALARKQW